LFNIVTYTRLLYNSNNFYVQAGFGFGAVCVPLPHESFPLCACMVLQGLFDL
jgi:hypothetical protein